MFRPLFRYGLLLVFLLQLLTGCGSDELKKVKVIPGQKLVLNKDRTLGVELTYSDSAQVKAKGYAPVLDQVTESTGAVYQEMPKGIKIDFYELTALKGSITSQYAIRKESDKLTIFRKNVIVTYPDGKYTCEELTWDENKKMYFSPAGLYTKMDGSVLNATNFTATQDFSRVTMSQASAEIYTKDSFKQ